MEIELIILSLLFLAMAIVFYKIYNIQKNENLKLKEYIELSRNENQELKINLSSQKEYRQNSQIRIDELKDDLEKQKDINTEQNNNLSDAKVKISELQTQLQEQQTNIHKNEEKLKTEFKNLATEILDNNSKKFKEQNNENLGHLLNPMKQQLNEFKKKVEDVYDKESKDRSALQQELKTLKELNQKISTDAINLTKALKGEVKQQGSWGEMVLEKVLESSGLRLGIEYIREETLKNNDGEKYRPDVIVNLPQNRHIIIDAKTSLTAYEQYVSTQDDIEKTKFLNNHLISINKHIDTLANKSYEKLKGINTLDFIFMFVPIESALMLAIENDIGLFDKAFKKKIVLVSPTTLLVALKAVENSWRYEKQAQNTTEVIRLAEKLYTKVKTFVDEFEKVGKHLNIAQMSYDDAHKKLSSGKDNIIRQIEIFKNKSSITPTKQISQELVDSAMNERI